MNLFKKPGSPFWWGSYTVDGKQHRFSTKRPFSDKTGAMKVLAQEYNRHQNEAQFGQKPQISLQAAMDRVVASVDGKTQESYKTSRDRWLGQGAFNVKGHWSLDPAMPLSKLNQHHLEDHLVARSQEGLKANSIIVEVRFIQRVCNMLAPRFEVNRDLIFNKPKPFAKTRYLSDEEVQAVMNSLRDKAPSPAYVKALDLMIFLLNTGVRLHEATALEWSAISFPRKTIEVYRDKTDILSLIPMSRATEEVLQRLHNQPRPFENMSRAIRILRTAIDTHCNTNATIVRQRGKATIHTLRDTYATRLDMAGVSLGKIAKLLGHTSIKMASKYAQTESRDAVAAALAVLDAQPKVA
ncbi:site-specific integrase [Xinfangfangia sp. CPCC 101601]|uniref:Site-specific integrase n=1 Tax=Pseudogemmobacter lacusdianii TaxID=3069608 RepID=A0ABU0VYB9_9RHOB|nr:site-specific integrase [Xinfangfangia sp. CPCC 101601]MDQ2066759.1 site-specific integrase [Xinfangfangia sp. CPCC 101601]